MPAGRRRFTLERTVMNRVLSGLTAVFVAGSVCGVARAGELTVFAAASLSDALKEIAVIYQKQSGDRVVFNFGASSVLARQIEEGAPADIFFSADEAKMDGLEKLGLILKETRRSRLSNSLVIVVAADSPLHVPSAHHLAGDKVKRIALADPKAVPAGVYARAYLEKARVWTAVERKIIPTENVRAALLLVSRGEAPLGIVYESDAVSDFSVARVGTFPENTHPRIAYPIAVTAGSTRPAVYAFVDMLKTPEARAIFEKQGFTPLN